MKTNFDTLVLYVILFLAIAIFVSVLFGCAFRKGKEHFSNSKSGLSKFENQMLEGISSGSIGAEQIAKSIKEGQFTQENLANMIKHAETMRNGGKKNQGIKKAAAKINNVSDRIKIFKKKN